jgi:hypothetical protein
MDNNKDWRMAVVAAVKRRREGLVFRFDFANPFVRSLPAFFFNYKVRVAS